LHVAAVSRRWNAVHIPIAVWPFKGGDDRIKVRQHVVTHADFLVSDSGGFQNNPQIVTPGSLAVVGAKQLAKTVTSFQSSVCDLPDLAQLASVPVPDYFRCSSVSFG
jgi:hypothetical protein